MRKLNNAIDRFCLYHPRFGIPNLMRYVVFITAAVFVLDLFSSGTASSILDFDLGLIGHGEVWRLITWLFVPEGSSLWILISLLCYYSIGSTVEQSWGRAKFTLFYFTGAALTVVFSLVSLLWNGYPIVSNSILNNILFLAFATLYPTATVRVQLILPIQAKWLAVLYVVLTVYDILKYGFWYFLMLLPMLLAAWLTYAVFFWDRIGALLAEFGFAVRHANNPHTIQFKAAAKKQRQKEAAQGYRHKCAVCGRTDTEHPELEFRYCSRCAGYHCFCQDHIFDHVHFTE